MKSEVLERIGIKVKNADNLIKFIPILIIIDNDSLEDKLKILKFHKIPIIKFIQIKVLALDSRELERRITISKSNNFFTEVMLEPLTLLDLNRFSLKKQKTVSFNTKVIPVPFREDKKIEFIELANDEDEFDKILNDTIVNFSPKIKEPESMINTSNIEINQIDKMVSEQNYERYERLNGHLLNILKNIEVISSNKLIDLDDYLMTLVVDFNYTDEEILRKVVNVILKDNEKTMVR